LTGRYNGKRAAAEDGMKREGKGIVVLLLN
jgi:hypothetical protein